MRPSPVSLILLAAAGLFFSAPLRAETAAEWLGARLKEPYTKYAADGSFVISIPPGERVEADQTTKAGRQSWKMADGSEIRAPFSSWHWKEMPEKEGKRKGWGVVVVLQVPGSSSWYTLPGDEFASSEAEALLHEMWRTYHTVRARDKIDGAKIKAAFDDAAQWDRKLVAYTGNEERKPGEKGLPSLRDDYVSKAPDLRTFKDWYYVTSYTDRLVHPKVEIVDWAVKKHRIVTLFLGGTTDVKVRIRHRDGKEETVSAARLRPESAETYAIYGAIWKDWARLVAAGGEIPHRELKMTALREMLIRHWETTRMLREQEKQQAEAAVAAAAAKQKGPYFFGAKLEFPGAAPRGYRSMDGSQLNRALIPVLDQGEFGTRASDCLPSSIATFFLWWDEQGFLPLNQKGDLRRRSNWLHSQFGREMRTMNNGGTSWGKVHKGLTGFSEKHLDSRYAFFIYHDRDYSMENLRRYMQSGCATVLSVETWNGPRHAGHHAIPAFSLDEKGTMIMATWGMKLTGTWKEVELPGSKGKTNDRVKELPALEFFPEGLSDKDKKTLRNQRFILRNGGGIFVIEPFMK